MPEDFYSFEIRRCRHLPVLSDGENEKEAEIKVPGCPDIHVSLGDKAVILTRNGIRDVVCRALEETNCRAQNGNPPCQYLPTDLQYRRERLEAIRTGVEWNRGSAEIDKQEKALVVAALRRGTPVDITTAANFLGTSEEHVQELMERYGISLEELKGTHT